VDVVEVLGWLAERGVTALLKADGERMSEGVRPWTFVASGGVLAEAPVHIDAASPADCLRRAVPMLVGHGLDLPGELLAPDA
jgi:hypothetical protein